MQIRTRSLRSLVRATLVGASLGALGACASNHQRAWANGQAMTSSRAFRAAAHGDMSARVHRELYSSADARVRYWSESPYAPFGKWW